MCQFKDRLGYCTKLQKTLYSKPGARPIFQPKRPIAYDRTALEREVKPLRKRLAITPIIFSD